MSASFPQMAFWVIFPLAALIVLSGWVMIILSAVKKLRSQKGRGANEATVSFHPRRSCPPPAKLDSGGRDRSGRLSRRPSPLGAWRLDNQPPPLRR